MPTPAATEITLIQLGRRFLQLDDDTYRLMLSNLTGGKTSSKALNERERQTVLNHMKARGFVVKPRANKGADKQALDAWQHEPQMRKLRAMWYVLADAAEVDRPAGMESCNAAIEAWAKRQMSTWDRPPSALRFATGATFTKLIEEMKAWLTRLKLPTA